MHVVALCRTKICQTSNAGDFDADVVEVGRKVLTDTEVAVLYALWYWEPT